MLQSIVSFLTRQKQPEASPSNNSVWKWVSDRFRWRPTSLELLELYEQQMLSLLKKPFALKYVDIPNFGQNDKPLQIRTVSIQNEDNGNRVPLVLLHGLGAALGLWAFNFNALSEQGPVHAIDLPGFGMSSRPDFGKTASEVEEQFVEAIENWRKAMNLQKFILLGHSMGGYIASAYAMKYPQNVCHVIFADPWGFSDRSKHSPKLKLPIWARAIATVVQFFNPFAALRLAGPLGPGLIAKFRPDILLKFSPDIDHSVVSSYVYHCNAQNPSGETAFRVLSEGMGWARLPMINRVNNLPEDVPLTFIYGSRSWVSSEVGYEIEKMRPNVLVKIIRGAGHHVYVDRYNVFNTFVLEACHEVNDFTYELVDMEQFKDSKIEPTMDVVQSTG